MVFKYYFSKNVSIQKIFMIKKWAQNTWNFCCEKQKNWCSYFYFSCLKNVLLLIRVTSESLFLNVCPFAGTLNESVSSLTLRHCIIATVKRYQLVVTVPWVCRAPVVGILQKSLCLPLLGELQGFRGLK